MKKPTPWFDKLGTDERAAIMKCVHTKDLDPDALPGIPCYDIPNALSEFDVISFESYIFVIGFLCGVQYADSRDRPA